MYRGKRLKKYSIPASLKRSPVLVAALAVTLLVTVAGTFAFLVDDDGPVKNQFIPSSVPNKVVEEFDGEVKDNVVIKNEGNIDAYIRAAVVVNWVDKDGNIYGTAPVEGEDGDYSMTWSGLATNGGWAKGLDGFYYYLSRVVPDGTTNVLFTDCKPLVDNTTQTTLNQPEGYSLSVEIVAQSIQADGVDAAGEHPVVLAWGVANGGSVTSVSGSAPDETLVINQATNG